MSGRWDWLTLADVLVKQKNGKPVQQGWSPKCHDYPADSGAWGVLKTTAIQAGSFEPIHNKKLPERLDPKPQIQVAAGDLLITCAGPRSRCGVPALVRATPPRLMMSGKMYRFRPDGRLDARFLEYWLLSPHAQKLIDTMKTGISESGLNLTHSRFVGLPVPVPSLDEQRRIVNLLEGHLSRLDAAKSLTINSSQRLGRMRQASLIGAIRDAEAAAAGESVRLGDIATIATGMTPLRSNKDFYEGGSIPWVTSGDLHQGIIREPKQFVTDRAVAETSLKVIPAGALLVAMYGEGKTRGTVAELAIDATINQACAAIILNDRSLKDWVLLVLAANYDAMRRLAAGGVQPNLNLSLVRSIELPMPPVDVRNRLRSRVEESDVIGRRLATSFVAASSRAGLFRRSLLAAAFSGRLTATSDVEDLP